MLTLNMHYLRIIMLSVFLCIAAGVRSIDLELFFVMRAKKVRYSYLSNPNNSHTQKAQFEA